MPPIVVGVAILTYIAFVSLMVYVDQFDYPWFGGYLNVVAITFMNIFFAAIVLWHMYGKKLNPHQAYEDRSRHITTVTYVMIFTSIAATVFVALSALDWRDHLPIAQSLYFQLLAVIGFRVYRLSEFTDFDVYKENNLAT